MNILFVDDENLICISFKAMIEKYTRHSVVCAFTVEEALKEISEHSFDILITDYQLTDSTGADLVRTIRQNGMKIPVIAISGYFTDEIIEEMSDYGVDHYINKPFQFEELLGHLDEVSPPSKADIA